MKFAVISDVHGNNAALQAVLEDANKQQPDRYLFAGDYYGDSPFPNEVVQAIRRIDNAAVIRGNKEDYLVSLDQQDPQTWKHDQFAPLYWAYRELVPEHLEYLMNLPEEWCLDEANSPYIRMFHAPAHLYAGTNLKPLGSSSFVLKQRRKPFTHPEYLTYVSELLQSDVKLAEILEELPEGVYIFGHTHVQWHARLGNHLLINPGSCGLPLDGDKAAPYTLIEWDGEAWQVEERRVPYDVEAAIGTFRDSGLYRSAKVWCEIMIEQLETAEERISFFFKLAGRLARERNVTEWPFPNEIWNQTADVWAAARDEKDMLIG